jgi:hypothetical protein
MADGLWPVWSDAVWSQHLFLYCERGLSSALTAEPVNALTNLAFVAVALWWLRRPTAPTIRFLASLAAMVGIGSLLFHTFAQRWAQVADVLPIAAFMTAATVVVAVSVLQASAREIAVAFAGVALAATALGLYGAVNGCQFSSATLTDLTLQPNRCLNGGLAYVLPGFVLASVAILLAKRHVPGANRFMLASVVFAVSLAARSADIAICPLSLFDGLRLTGHAVWHLGTAFVAHLIISGIAAAVTSSAIPTRP